MSTTPKDLNTVANASGERPAAEDLRQIISAAADPKSIISAFGGPGRLNFVLQALDRMDQACPDVGYHVFRRIPGESGPQAAERLCCLMQEWDDGLRPSFPALARAWLKELGIDQESSAAKILMLAAARAEMVKGIVPLCAKPANDEPDYHNRSHYLQVFQTCCYLLQAQRELQQTMLLSAQNDPLLQAQIGDYDACTLMIDGITHDVDHPGCGNPKDPLSQKQVRFYNEDVSSSTLYPLVLGVVGGAKETGSFYSIYETLNRFTDPGTPRGDARKAIEGFRNGQTPEQSADYFVRPDAAFWACAAILTDADILLSAACGEEAFARGGTKLTKEAGKAGLSMDFTTTASRQFFFDNIVGPEGLLSGPARILFNPIYQQMRQKNELALKPS